MNLFLLAVLSITLPPVNPGTSNRQPQLAADAKAVDVVFGSGNSIWFAQSSDAGRSFSPPTKVSAVPAMALGRHRGPRIAISGKTLIVTAIYGQAVSSDAHAHGLPEQGDLVAWRSEDQGRTWSAPLVINDVPGSAREGLHAMAAGQHGEVVLAWLDLRAKGTRLYGAYSTNAGTSWSKNVLLYQSDENTICQCCHPSLISVGPNRFAVMFRNALEGSRDLYRLTWSIADGPGPVEKVSAGTWKLEACPMDGGGLAVQGKAILTAWRREDAVYLTNGAKEEQVVGKGKNVSLATTKRGAYVAWTQPDGIRVKRPGSTEPERISSTGDFPVLTPVGGNRVLLAWEDSGAIKLAILE